MFVYWSHLTTPPTDGIYHQGRMIRGGETSGGNGGTQASYPRRPMWRHTPEAGFRRSLSALEASRPTCSPHGA